MSKKILALSFLTVLGCQCLHAENIAVVGGDFSGLTAAKTALENGHSVTLLESRSSTGGKVFSQELGGIKVNLGLHNITSKD